MTKEGGVNYDKLAASIGEAVHSLTTSINHRLAHPVGLDDDCAVLGRVIADRVCDDLAVEVDPEHNPGYVMGPCDEVPRRITNVKGA